MITSKDNPKIKQVRLLQASSKVRRESNAFVIEGIRLVEEALASGWTVQWVIYTDALDARGQELVNRFAGQGVPVDQVTEQVIRSASDTQTPQGVLAVLELRPMALPGNLDFIFIPDGVRDPGNFGTMLRTALAAGVQVVLLPPGSVDPFSPKVVRSAMGAHLRLPILSLSWIDIKGIIARTGARIYLAESKGGEIYSDLDWTVPLALIIGGEAEGAGTEAQALATERVFIPMPGKSESLNAASAAAILLFEAVRQRESR